MNPSETFSQNADLPAAVLFTEFPRTPADRREDALQEGALALWRCAQCWDGKREFRAYAYSRIKKRIYLFLLRMSTPLYVPSRERTLENYQSAHSCISLSEVSESV